MKKTGLFFIFIAFLYSASAQNSVKIYADKNTSFIRYKMYHPLHDWTGVSKDVNSVILYNTEQKKILKAAVKTKVESFDSKNANRDSHMLEVTEAFKYPYITFITTEIVDEGQSLEVSGVLEFHGVKKNIKFKARKQIIAENKVKVSGDFSVKVTDFNIKRPSLLGIPVEDKIDIDFEVYYNKVK